MLLPVVSAGGQWYTSGISVVYQWNIPVINLEVLPLLSNDITMEIIAITTVLPLISTVLPVVSYHRILPLISMAVVYLVIRDIFYADVYKI